MTDIKHSLSIILLSSFDARERVEGAAKLWKWKPCLHHYWQSMTTINLPTHEPVFFKLLVL
jgi:hypothetical protein